MNVLDYIVLVGTILGIAAYGIWKTRGQKDLGGYLKGSGKLRWGAIGLSVMATQASAITFLSTPGQGFESGLGFIQFYFATPLALVIIAAVFLPIYRKLNVYTAYEFLGRRFDMKTRLFGAAMFLIGRGLAAGITIYAPAIILSTVFGWNLNTTILLSGIVAIVYTVAGGSEGVSLTQKYQMTIILCGMAAAFVILLMKLPAGLSFGDALTVAGAFHKTQAVDFSFDIHKRYTFWSGMLGGLFLLLSYFGTDQSQVQRYLGGETLSQSRLGLMFNGVFKIPMQFSILLLGIMLCVFYQFERPPVFFNQAGWAEELRGDSAGKLKSLDDRFGAIHAEKRQRLTEWLDARRAGDTARATEARTAAVAAYQQSEDVRAEVKKVITESKEHVDTKDSDYVFITFVIQHLPHGLVGLLVAVIFAAALSSKASELSSLGSTTVVDFYRYVFKPDATDEHYLLASKFFTAFWGVIALLFALFAHLVDNLIQAVNILGSLFYGVILGLFVVGFFIKHVGGAAVFWAAVVAQVVVAVLFLFYSRDYYLWYNLVGCAVCVVLSLAIQAMLGEDAAKRAQTVA